MTAALRIIAWLLTLLMAVFWVWGQDLLDGMATAITSAALVLPAGAAVVATAAWWTLRARRKAPMAKRSSTPDPDRGSRLDASLALLGIFIVAWPFALVLDRMGHTPHQTFVSAALASAWDAGGLVLIVFCGASAILVGRG